MKIIIYIITNTINEKVYIGQTIKPIEKRFQEHCQKSSQCIKIRNAIQKYGKENFSIKKIVSCYNRMSANTVETFWISVYDSVDNGYNIVKIANSFGSINTGRKASEESKKKMSELRLGKPASEISKKKISLANTGKPSHAKNKTWKMVDGKRTYFDKSLNLKNTPSGWTHTEESKKKISDNNKGRKTRLGMKNSDETNKKISNSLKGRDNKRTGIKHTNQSKLKISQAGKGRKASLQAKENMSKAQQLRVANETVKRVSPMKGKHQSIEAKEAMSKNKKNRSWKLINGKRVWSKKLED